MRGQNSCAEGLIWNHGGQRGNLLANILIRRIQNYYRRYRTQKSAPMKINSKPLARSAHAPALLKQAQVCLDNKKLDDRSKAKSLSIQHSIVTEEKKAQDRRQAFAKSKTEMQSMNHSDESE